MWVLFDAYDYLANLAGTAGQVPDQPWYVSDIHDCRVLAMDSI